jgi:hypothetical protein
VSPTAVPQQRLTVEILQLPALEQLLSGEYPATELTRQVKVTMRLTVSQSVSLGVEPHLELMTRYLLLFDNYGLVFVGRPL